MAIHIDMFRGTCQHSWIIIMNKHISRFTFSVSLCFQIYGNFELSSSLYDSNRAANTEYVNDLVRYADFILIASSNNKRQLSFYLKVSDNVTYVFKTAKFSVIGVRFRPVSDVPVWVVIVVWWLACSTVDRQVASSNLPHARAL